MINKEQLSYLLNDLESDRVERTITISNTEKFSIAVCAFANDLPNHQKPGYLLIGVKDDGGLSGLKVTDELLKNLGGLRSDGLILPQPQINIAHFVLEGGDVAVVEVLPSMFPPIRYKGNIWVRIGPRKATANEAEERMLIEKRISSATTFDSRPCLDATINDLDLEEINQTIALYRIYKPDSFIEDAEDLIADLEQALA